MAFTDNFGHPRGLLGRMMLVSMEREHLPMAKWAFSKLEVPAQGNIMDIGCGGGYNVKRLLEASPQATVIGLDLSEESVRKARKINRQEIEKRCRIFKGSVEKLMFQDDQFDLVTAFETVIFWPDLSENIKEVYRVVNRKGKFAVINNYGDPKIDWEKKIPCMKRYTAEEIGQFMEAAGFIHTIIDRKDNLFFIIGEKG